MAAWEKMSGGKKPDLLKRLKGKERKMYSRFKNVYSFQRNGVSNLLSAYNSLAKVSKISPQAST